MTAGAKHDVIVGVIVTDRAESLDRLLATLSPAATDPCVHVVVLDNGTSAKTRNVVQLYAMSATGKRLCVSSSSARLPLHSAREELSRFIAENAGSVWDTDPIVWLVDDDVCFEALLLRDGRIKRENVAVERITQVRELFAQQRCDLLVSGFTGDPPVRPNAVISCQLGDLASALASLAHEAPSADFPQSEVSPELYLGDYYYAHREDQSGAQQLFPWLSLSPPTTVANELRRMFTESLRIESGGGVFRPLVQHHDVSLNDVTEVDAPNRGGNAVFFGITPLLAHTYPAFPVGVGFSRRSDMIGAALLARSGFKVAEGTLTLRHDRTGQRVVSPRPEDWLQEFAGVMLARLVMRDLPPNESVEGHLRRIAKERARRIDRDAAAVHVESRHVLHVLRQRPAVWWSALSPSCVKELEASLVRIGQAFENARERGVFELLSCDDVLERVLSAHAQLEIGAAVA